MTFEIYSINEEAKDLLSEALDRIKTLIDNSCHPNISLYITDITSLPTVNSNPILIQMFNDGLKDGFGMCKGNLVICNSLKSLIVLNIDLIKQYSLEDMELDAVLAHEFGHLLNMPEVPKLIPELSVGDDGEVQVNKEAIEMNKVEKMRNQLNKEIYADYYVKSIGLGEALISSLEKYSSMPDAQNIDMIERRIECLKSNNVYYGSPLI